MTEKIEWYREVLELEPNSKVFFPLSRLLAEDGQTQEAISTLKSGLERHPEYLEARLYLIELLHKYGFTDQCTAQVDQLSRMFASYAGFWRAWAACLSSEKEADTASILRFLAAQFVAGPIQLHDVLNKGLEAFMAEAAPHMEKENFPENISEAATPLMGTTDAAETGESGSVAEEILPESSDPAVEEPPVLLVEDLTEDSELSPAAPLDLPETLEDAAMADDIEAGEAELEAPSAEPETLPETMADASFAIMGEEPALVAQEENSDLSQAEQGEEPAVMAADAEAGQTMEAVASPDELDELDAIMEEAAETADSGEELALGTDPLAEDLPAVENESLDLVEDTSPVEEPMTAMPVEEVAPDVAGAEDALAAEVEQSGDLSGMAPEEAAPEPASPVKANAGEASLLSMESAIDNLELPDVSEPELPSPDLELESEEVPAVLSEESENEVLVETPPQVEAPTFGEKQKGEEPSDFEDTPEPFSLRTRSMAEVLAEQGDIQGALDIYHELAATASAKDEVEDINRRIATLEGRLGFKAPQQEYGEPEHSSPSRDKLIGMLEALAHRVEARANS